MATNTVAQTRQLGRYLGTVAITPKGDEAYVLHRAGQYVSVIDVADDRLARGDRLDIGQSKISPDGRFRLTMQSDGNLVLYSATGDPLWHSRTDGSGATHAILQTDGNFVVYTAAREAKWHTNTWGTAADRMVVQNDSNLVLYGGPNAAPYWHRW